MLASGCDTGYTDARADPQSEYRTVAEAGPMGSAPNARAHRLSDTSYMLILEDGDELFTALDDFARNHRVTAASFTALGALRDVQLAWYDLALRKFKVNRVEGQVEAASIVGDVGIYDGKPSVHTHLVVAREDATTAGGHLLHATASPTIEAAITVHADPLYKHHDNRSGLTLFD
ncbi:PPC domain-containing DNA-binding protein [Mycobacteroides chelonae]|uniref:PPC domain-containing DNA-binding protein n=1 Tax=Mycobacteroides chelonae TaxID=1774 RepID=UPI0012FF63AD|nr:PPC domain-containing DNA-binding protein [Mycobacteroides chelonae]